MLKLVAVQFNTFFLYLEEMDLEMPCNISSGIWTHSFSIATLILASVSDFLL